MARGIHDDGFIQFFQIVIENLLGAVLVINELMISNADNVSMFKPMGYNEPLVDKSTVFALQVKQHKPVPHRVYFGMMPGYRQILNDNVIHFPPSNRQGEAILKLVLSQQLIFYFKR